MRILMTLSLIALMVAPVTTQDTDEFVVHEWGTFTSFSGSDGLHLEFRPLIDEDLPEFVLDRPRQAGIHMRAQRFEGKKRIETKQRMETPVTYFYSSKNRTVNVRVDFPDGLLTEFYPPVQAMGPKFDAKQPEQIKNSYLTWRNVRILANAKNAKLPDAGKKPHYAYARETDSNIVQVGTHFEKFLFYRGVGNFALPVSAKAMGGDKFNFINNHDEVLGTVFLVEAKKGKIRFAKVDRVAIQREITLPKETSTLENLSNEVVEALVAEGLYKKEAQSMVKTWRDSWFGEDGTRIFYSVPQKHTDKILPIAITPKPDKLVRVLVGRLEILTPEIEKEIERLIGRLGAETMVEREAAEKALSAFGRFAEPALKRIIKITDDAEIRARAKKLLELLRK